MIKSLSESQNLGFVRTLTTCDVVLEAVDAMDLLLPKLREDSLRDLSTPHAIAMRSHANSGSQPLSK